MTTNHPQRLETLNKGLQVLAERQPDVMAGFGGMHKAARRDGALSAKTKELMALAISIVVHCDGCIAFHVHDAIQAGATRDEVAETVGLAVMMGGGPAAVYAAEALEAFDQFTDGGSV